MGISRLEAATKWQYPLERAPFASARRRPRPYGREGRAAVLRCEKCHSAAQAWVFESMESRIRDRGARPRGTMHPPMRAEIAFALELKHGICIGVRIPADDDALRGLASTRLHSEEVVYAGRLAPLARRTWTGGRVALREALARVGVDPPPILRNDRGAPALPAGIMASVTHKQGLAAALVSRETSAQVGVDLELEIPRTYDIARQVLTAAELAEITSWPAAEREREVLLRFSAKESVYKAIDPFVRRFVGFREVAVRPHPDGGATVEAKLARGEGPFVIDVTWRRFDGLVLTTARARSS
jgi:4'-phosphopantetheinyl transferase EntD